MRFWFSKKPADNPYDLLQPKTDAPAPATGSVPTASAPGSVPAADGHASQPSEATGSVPTGSAPGSVPNATGSVPGVDGHAGRVTLSGDATGSVPNATGSVPGVDGHTGRVTLPSGAAGTVPTTSPKRDRKEFYYGLMNALYDAVVVLDANGHITDCSERVVSVLARTREELWDLSINEIIPSLDAKILRQMQDGLHGKRRVLLNARCRRGDGSLFPAEIGAGLMNLIGESLVLTIRNVEKRTPVKAIVHAPAPGDRPHASDGDRPRVSDGDRPQPLGDSPRVLDGDRPQSQGDRPHASDGDRPRSVMGDSPRMAVFRTPIKARAAVPV